MITPNITALSPGVGVVQDVLGGWRAPVYACGPSLHRSNIPIYCLGEW